MRATRWERSIFPLDFLSDNEFLFTTFPHPLVVLTLIGKGAQQPIEPVFASNEVAPSKETSLGDFISQRAIERQMNMKTYAILLAAVTGASAFACEHRDVTSIGNRLGDGAYMKATGMSAVEWAAMRGTDRDSSISSTSYSSQPSVLTETERLAPSDTPSSTEPIVVSRAQTDATLINSDASISAGPSASANLSASTSDTAARDISPSGDIVESHPSREVNSSASVASGSDLSRSYNQEHSAIYNDRFGSEPVSNSPLNTGLGGPATFDRGTGTSSAYTVSSPEAQSAAKASGDTEWSSKIRTDLTKESADNTTAHTFTSESLKGVDIRRANGVVTLSGSIPSETEKRDLEMRIKKMSGVNLVVNSLRVSPSSASPKANESTDSGASPSTSTGNDAAIKTETDSGSVTVDSSANETPTLPKD